jgi:pimeloyl-ACP methyl ester carboxylesterase
MPQVRSKDGTEIGFDKSGNGPLVVIVNGALGYRDYYGDRELAQILSSEFTVIIYDRRGRGESTDTPPYAVEREIEDMEALVDVSGGQACLYGVSSGAALALRAAAKLGHKVTKLVMYEPPYGMGDADREEHARATRQLNDCLARGDRSGAVAVFMGNFMSSQEIEEFRKTDSEEWATMEVVAPTLAYDYAIMAEEVPPSSAASVTAPTLIMTGSQGLPYLEEAIEVVARSLPKVGRETLEGEGHTPSAGALAPRLIAFFRS